MSDRDLTWANLVFKHAELIDQVLLQFTNLRLHELAHCYSVAHLVDNLREFTVFDGIARLKSNYEVLFFGRQETRLPDDSLELFERDAAIFGFIGAAELVVE